MEVWNHTRKCVWKLGRSQWIVGTSAFGLGVDYAHVRAVIVFESAYSIIDVLQFFGRAGRDAKTAHCFALVPQDKVVNDPQLQAFFSQEICRRKSLWSGIDEIVPSCLETNSQDFCDFCQWQFLSQRKELRSIEIGDLCE